MLLIKTNYPNNPRDCKKFIIGIIRWKFAACVNRVNNVKSHYMWEWKLVHSQEIILLIKTLPEKKEKLISYIKKNHPYEVPEISIIEMESDERYLLWMQEVLKK